MDGAEIDVCDRTMDMISISWMLSENTKTENVKSPSIRIFVAYSIDVRQDTVFIKM
jgi:hypothetical protein